MACVLARWRSWLKLRIARTSAIATRTEPSKNAMPGNWNDRSGAMAIVKDAPGPSAEAETRDERSELVEEVVVTGTRDIRVMHAPGRSRLGGVLDGDQ